MQARHVVVDGSNIATEGSSLPTLKQLDEAVREFLIENPDDVVTVVVDATFGHRIPPEERQLFEEAESGAEIVSPPAGAIGRGDAFLLRVADKVGAAVLSNDSFQEFHGEYEWLFDKGRLIGGKPVPGVGWIFTPRTPVRGPRSRESVKEAKRKKRDEQPEVPDESGLDMAAERSRGRSGERKLQRAIAVAVEEAVEPAKSGRKRRRRRRVGELPAEPLNEPLNFITFIAGNQLGDEVEGTVEEFSSHGAFISVGGARCYLPLAGMGNEPPRSAREVLRKGERRIFVVQAFDAMRRGIELALPGFAHPAGAPTPETVDAEIHRGEGDGAGPAVKATPARTGSGRRPAKVAGTAKQALARDGGAMRAKKAAPTKKAAPSKVAAPTRTGAPTKAVAATKAVAPTRTAATQRPAKKAVASTETVPKALTPAKKPALQRAATPAKTAGPASGSAVADNQARAKRAAPAEQAPPTKRAAPGRNPRAAKKAAAAKASALVKVVGATKKATAAKKVAAPVKVANQAGQTKQAAQSKQAAQTKQSTAKATTPAGRGRAPVAKQPAAAKVVAAKVAVAKKASAAREKGPAGHQVTTRRELRAAAGALSATLVLAGLAAACGGGGGAGPATAPAAPTSVTAVGLESDGSGACAILYHRDVKCWGLNDFGQLGDNSDKPSNVPISVSGLTGVLSLVGESSQGGYCAVLLSGGVDCWGTNTSGALGNGSTTLTQADVPVAVTGISDATNGGTNNAFTYCMLLGSESVRCWGDNSDGQLGDGSTAASSNVPVGVLGVFKPVGLASDGTSFCAQLKSGGAQCWGDNADGALGNGSTVASSNVPVAVQGLNYIQKLFAGAGGYCAVIDGGGVKCWGANEDGSLGDGKASGYSAVPVAVKGLSGVSSIDGSCAVLGNGTVKCWGNGVDGELGNGTTGQQSDVAVPVKGLSGVSELAGNYCALLEKGGVECWGSNDNDGALGNGSKVAFSDVAVPVKGIAGATGLVYDAAVGGGYCALLGTSGRVECWGDNHDGELGDGGKEPSSAVPVRVTGLGT